MYELLIKLYYELEYKKFTLEDLNIDNGTACRMTLGILKGSDK